MSPVGLGAAARGRSALQRRDLLPAPRKALRHRSGEQNLHTDSAPPPATGGPYSGAICSPLPAKPCSFVPGSKIFTQIPRRRLPPAAFTAARFAPCPPQSLAASSRGAKSSQKFRAAACLRRPFQRRDLLPAPRKALRHRSGEQNLHTDSAPPPASGSLFSGAICSPLPAKPCGTVPGSKIFTQIPRRRLPPAAFSAARFAPRPPQRLAAPSRGAKSSQRFRAAACLRPAFPRRDLLPAPRKPLRLRSGEQNLHSNSAPPPATGGLYSGAICSPLLAKPCSFVSGSKIFTEIPRRRLPPAAFTAARFAPRPPQSLAAPFWEAKSSQRFRAAARGRSALQRRDLLPAPRKALRLRSGEQNLHRNSAPPPATGGLFSGAICSPLLTKPCGSVPGSKIFTAIPRRRLPLAAFSAARFAPRSSQSLAAPSRGAKSSQQFRAAACLRRPFQRRDLLPAPRKALRHRSGEQNLHTDSAPPLASGRLFRGAICSPLLAKPCSFVPGSKIFTQIPRRRLPPATFSAARFAPRSPQTLAAPSRGAKSSHKFRAAAYLRRLFQRRDLLPAPRKALQLRSGEQNLHRNSAPPPEAGRLLKVRYA